MNAYANPVVIEKKRKKSVLNYLYKLVALIKICIIKIAEIYAAQTAMLLLPRATRFRGTGEEKKIMLFILKFA